MLSNLVKTGFVTNLQQKALDEIKKDRDKFALVWDTIETYCRQHKIIISDKYALVGEQDTLPSIYEKNYKLYTQDPFKHANILTNLIHKNTNNKYIRLKTIYEHEELAIEYDLRIVCIIYKMQRSAMEIVIPEKIDGNHYLSPEIEIIDVYKDLYTMNNSKQALEFEEKLFKKVLERKEKGVFGGNCKDLRKQLIESIKVALIKDWLRKTKTGGNKNNKYSNDNKYNSNKYNNNKYNNNNNKNGYKEFIDESSIDNPLQNNKYVLLGSWARNWIKQGDALCADVEKIQMVGLCTPEQLRHELQTYISEIHDVKVSFKEQELHIPKDFRTNRYTFYMKFQDERGTVEKPFLDLFNSANFELVPYYIINGIAIAHKYFLLRFLFIDLWIVRLIRQLGLLTSDILDRKIQYLWSVIEYFRNEKQEGEPQFMGRYRDFNIDKKLDRLGVKIPYPYYPEIYFESNKKYRDI